MKLTLRRTTGAKFETTNEAGNVALLDGPEEVGGTGEAVRPMEMVLIGLAGCAAMDVLLILQKGRHEVRELEVEVDGERADAIPAVFTDVHMRFVANGDFDEHKLKRAVDLSIEKYCSVARMLESTVKITWDSRLKP